MVQVLPVAHGGGGRLHPEHALGSVRDGQALAVEQAHFDTRSRGAGTARTTLTWAIGDEHEDGLGGADRVEDLDPEAFPPRLVDLGGQLFPCRDALTHGAERVGRKIRVYDFR